MGVLNVTSDSFSDGGLYVDREAAVRRGRQMVAEGADIVDIGGESTRPGASAVPPDEELHRVLPVVEALSGEVRVSIDTTKASVARAALAAGASLLNEDVYKRQPVPGRFSAAVARLGQPDHDEALVIVGAFGRRDGDAAFHEVEKVSAQPGHAGELGTVGQFVQCLSLIHI